MIRVAGITNHSGYERIDDEYTQEIPCEENIKCFGYSPSLTKQCFFHLFSLLLGGIPYLLLHWNCQYSIYMKCSKCPLAEAKILLIQDSHGQYSVQHVHTSLFSWPGSGEVKQIRYFHYHLLKFVWDDIRHSFTRLHGLDNGQTTLANLMEKSYGFSAHEQEQMRKQHGENLIIINVKSYWRLFIEEVFNPFYIFQVFSVTLWSLDEYYYYAGCVVFLSSVSVITSLIQTRRQSEALRDLVAASNTTAVTVRRRNGGSLQAMREKPECEEIAASDLVPGDVVVIPPHGCIMACDALLLSGNCIVNESMLTGESVPVTKTPPPHTDEPYDSVQHKRHTLFCGTQVIQTRFYGNEKVIAVVVRTGFSTAKGELVRSILFPKPMSGFKFYKDSVKFVIVLFIIASIGMAYCVYLYMARHAHIETILLRTLDIITIVVPPALPAAMTAGTVYSQNRLKKQGIFCISPPRINVSGKVKLVCFDKTGTLTEEGLDLWGVLPLESFTPNSEPIKDVSILPTKSPFIAAMATCHSLTIIDGQMTGDPLDLKMFEATKWILEEPGQDTNRYDMLTPTVVRPPSEMGNMEKLQPLFEGVCGEGDMKDIELPYEIGIVRQFPFGSAIQCMSVITRTLGARNMMLYTKGAPEKILSICKPETVPPNFSSLLMEYTLSGYRVIALAYKNLGTKFHWLQAQKVSREVLEKELEFLGLLIMQNTLKPETSPAINQLQIAKIRCVMVTGDNILTAVSVARDCGMVAPHEKVIQIKVNWNPHNGAQIEHEIIGASDPVSHRTDGYVVPLLANMKWHFAVDGKAWAALRNHYSELIPQIITRGTVFARMAPDQKMQLVESLQELDYIVAMCGDGANDCGALKAAHIGISLSEAEASVAAPFTSRVANITCVLKLIQEGRCALVTSFGVFKYMALYSLIQFITVLILYTRESLLGNMQFLYIDLVITTSVAVLMGRTGPTSKLVAQRPMGSLVSPSNIIPLILQVLLMTAVQIAVLVFLTQQAWFHPAKPKNARDEIIVCWENTVLFCVSSYQYLILAIVYSKGRPYRKPFYTNVLFMLTLILLTAFTTLLLIYPIEPLDKFFELMPVSIEPDIMNFRLLLLGFPAVHLVAAVFVETCVADRRWLKVLLHWLTRKKGPKNKYKQIARNMTEESCWLSQVIS